MVGRRGWGPVSNHTPGKHVVLHHVSPRLQKLIDLRWGRPPRAIELDAA
jgi:hypothetical protein